ncbi:uncharacterized protein PHACADRAFT_262198 [Phanerochaete carnosa HHB-10118-sp]|uniref:F-box domain-containing protein n=1 Tax=Phanerochaete carnosa (strain HHB-10118-sp) TaxID=650164 RepID=K5WNG1_PHACS|nr:uncharacterized protein PHACADRAFT_262198 [Phanerochaete carnosa HHB-10118-sp]EKM51827.1 hypothetical protein PHACADRAFT_262198 [Phanerochaete carnosa HHB-10118-sp]
MAFTRIHVDALKDIKQQMKPREGPSFKYEMQGSLLRHKILAWRVFPINDLPTEILTMVFRNVRRTDPQLGCLWAMRITWVCRQWRYIAMADPVLWGTIIFDDPYPWARSFRYFERAGAGDVAFRLADRKQKDDQGNDIAPKITAEQMQEFLAKIYPKYHQIRASIFVLDTWPAAAEVLKFFSHPNTRSPRVLECFEVHRPSTVIAGEPWLTPGFRSPCILQPVTLFCGDAPKLRSICLNGINVRWAGIPCTNLRTLDLRRIPQALCPSSADFLDMLRATNNIRRLNLDIAGPVMVDTAPCIRHPVHLTRLKELFLGGATPTWMQWAMTHFVAPQLAVLAIARCDLVADAPLCTFLAGRFPRLESLALFAIRYATTIRTPLLKWLASLPRLRVVKFSHMPREIMLGWLFEDARLFHPEQTHRGAQQQAALTQDSPIFAPNLTSLYPDMQAVRDVIEFVKKRKELGASLERVHIPALYRSTPEEEAELRELGVEVVRGMVPTKEEQDIETRWEMQFGR